MQHFTAEPARGTFAHARFGLACLDGLHAKHCFGQPDARRRFHGAFHKSPDRLSAVSTFGCIDDVMFPSEKAIIFSMICAMVIIFPPLQ